MKDSACLGRRNFLRTASLAALAGPAVAPGDLWSGGAPGPVVISTWSSGLKANPAAWEVLQTGGRALDAVEAGVRVVEDDPDDMSVGYGGLPDRDGNVTLDACIMDDEGNCGAVAFLQHIRHPISVARRVMEKTPHVMLVGEGALRFALSEGFRKENLLTEKAREAWQKWLKDNKYQPQVRPPHDTIGMLALDRQGRLSGACTTSGLAFKMHGRVGDSPIIGAGLYVDNGVGAATATGNGEEMIRLAGSAMIVEQMRNGRSPQEACEALIKRLWDWRHNRLEGRQVCFIALDKLGRIGAFSLRPGFEYTLSDVTGGHRLLKAPHLLDK
jgi:N4-(beta-N-acetylglucosaminyl)-L-asparaginase